MSTRNRRPTAPAIVSVLFLLGWFGPFGSGCATGAPYRWVDELPAAADAPAGYRIAPSDVLGVKVWNQEAMSVERARVREDGKISLPFLKDVPVAGLTPDELSERLQRQLVHVIVDPVVTVALVEPALLNVSVLGEVATPGAFTLPPAAGVLQAIAAAGGLTQYASTDGIYVLRRLEPGRPPSRIRFRYRDLAGGSTRAAGFPLQSGDVVLVE
jgi:polysaccharide export outer membrane protein